MFGGGEVFVVLSVQEFLHISYPRVITYHVLLGPGVCMKDCIKEYISEKKRVLYGEGTVVEHNEIW